MTIQQVTDALELTVYTDGVEMDTEIKGGYVSDLLSDVMGFAREGELWITLQAHVNVVAIASLKELPAIVLVKGIKPGEAVIEKAKEEGVAILGSSEGTFATGGKLFNLLNSE